MIPDFEAVPNIENKEMPTRTYELDTENDRIMGFVDDDNAIMQMARKLLNTERYAYVIYSRKYGIELEQLIGKDYDYVLANIERIVREAMLEDDRVISVTNFQTRKIDTESIAVTFQVNTTIGSAVINERLRII